MCRGLLRLLLRAPETPNTKCMGKLTTLGQFRPLCCSKIFMNWWHQRVVLHLHIKPGKLLNRLEVSGT